MQTYELLVSNRAVKANSKDTTLVRTSVGIDTVHVLFDSDEWLDFPITITFARGDVMRTSSIVVSELDSSEYACEASVEVPWEVIQTTGPIRVTLQGTDANGRHIITAKGSPLSVEESGDAALGDIPSDAPTVNQWQQAYAQAMEAANDAKSAAQLLESEANALIEQLRESVIAEIPEVVETPTATTDTAGIVKVGDGLSVTEDGTLSVDDGDTALTDAEMSLLYNLQLLALYGFDTTFIDGVLQNSLKVKRSALPLAGYSSVGAVKADNDTLTIDVDGTLHASRYVLPAATANAIGGVKPDGLTTVSNDGTVSVRRADVGVLGVVKPDGTTITISQDGTITASGGGQDGYVLPKATRNQLGGITVGDGLSIEDGVLSLAIPSAEDSEF